MGLGIRSGLIYPVVGRMPAGYTDPISGYQSRPDYSAGHKGSADIPNQPSRENTRKSDIHAWDKKKLWSVQNGFLGSDSAQCWPARSFSRIFFYSTQHYFSLSISRLGSIQERKKSKQSHDFSTFRKINTECPQYIYIYILYSVQYIPSRFFVLYNQTFDKSISVPSLLIIYSPTFK